MLLSDKVAIVTGGSKGIGRGIALKFAEEGCSVVVASTHRDEGIKTTEEISNKGGRSLFVQCDVTKAEQVQTMVNKVIERFGKIDILVNNAGGINVARTGVGMGQTEEEWDRLLDLNLKSVFLCCKAVIPHMKTRRYGKIINISSMGAIMPGRPNPGYHAAKAGVIGLTINLAFELAPFNINVNAILPGPIRTSFWEIITKDITDIDSFWKELAKGIPLQRYGTPEDIAGVALFLASELSSFVTGVIIPVSGGLPLGVSTSTTCYSFTSLNL